MDENATSPAEVQPPAPAPGENPPPAPPSAPVNVPAAPPATALVVNGNVKSEREIQLETSLTAAERRALEAERRAAELERDKQELLKIPAAPKAKAEKQKRNWLSPIIGADDE